MHTRQVFLQISNAHSLKVPYIYFDWGLSLTALSDESCNCKPPGDVLQSLNGLLKSSQTSNHNMDWEAIHGYATDNQSLRYSGTHVQMYRMTCWDSTAGCNKKTLVKHHGHSLCEDISDTIMPNFGEELYCDSNS